MANSLTYTSACFMYSTGVTASTTAGTRYDILTSTASDRRMYGLAVLSSSNSAEAVTIYITSATNSLVYQLSTVNVPAGSGTNGSAPAVDVFADKMGEAVFQKTRDANGLAYFNVPANWKLQMSFSVALTSPQTIITHIFGETY